MGITRVRVCEKVVLVGDVVDAAHIAGVGEDYVLSLSIMFSVFYSGFAGVVFVGNWLKRKMAAVC